MYVWQNFPFTRFNFVDQLWLVGPASAVFLRGCVPEDRQLSNVRGLAGAINNLTLTVGA